MTNTQTKQRLTAAARTLVRLPRSYLDRPGRPQSGWPEMQRTARLCVTDTRRASLPVPSPQAIDDMHEVIDALYTLSPAARKLLWARACGLPWAQLQLRLGGSRTHLNRRYRLALTSLTTCLDPFCGPGQKHNRRPACLPAIPPQSRRKPAGGKKNDKR